jgi:hypothetical protein
MASRGLHEHQVHLSLAQDRGHSVPSIRTVSQTQGVVVQADIHMLLGDIDALTCC